MKTIGNKRHLENFRIFPYVAWGLVISFSFFVYGIAQNLRSVAQEVSAEAAFLESAVQTPVADIETFER